MKNQALRAADVSSIGVKRVLTEFGAEESFEGAAKRFQEHYGFWVEKNAVRREVEAIANLGQQYIEHRLDSLKNSKPTTIKIKPKVYPD